LTPGKLQICGLRPVFWMFTKLGHPQSSKMR
jgi:hypothetical protein